MMGKSSWYSYGDIDIFLSDTSAKFNPESVYIYVEGEYGFIPLIVGKSIEAGGVEVAQIISRYQNIESFNRMPKPNTPGWRVTQVDQDTCFIAITNWFSHSDGRGEPNPDLWKNSYPMMRSLLEWLVRNGCKRITTLTSMNIIDADESQSVHVHSSKEGFIPQTQLSDELGEGIESYLALPAWAFPWLAHRMGIESEIVCVTQDEGQFIDLTSLTKTLLHFKKQDIPFDNKVVEKTIETLMSVEEELSSQNVPFDEDSMGDLV